MSLTDRIAKILRQHVGRDRLISARDIARRLRMTHRRAARDVRDAIALEDWSLREMVVVAIPGAGFFVAEDVEEIGAYQGFLAKLLLGALAKFQGFVDLAGRTGFRIDTRTIEDALAKWLRTRGWKATKPNP